ncbi:MAG: hypothetical protein JOZ82_07765, partial [Marmoricola sp.]|nr:hypothetical protein [Marmoricola sp.]
MHRSVAVAAAAVAVAGEAVAIAVSSGAANRWNEIAVGAVVVAWAAVGLLIVWHRPDHPIGRVALVSAMAWGPGGALVDLGANGLRADPTDRLAALANVVGAALGGLAWLVLVLWVPVIFPDGFRPVTRLRRTARAVILATLTAFTVVSLFSPTLTRIEFEHVDNPIGLPHSLAGPMDALAALNLLFGVTGLALGIACVVQQHRRGSALTRQQTIVFALAFLPPLAAFAASVGDSAGPWLFGLCTLPLPIAIGVAVLQRKLYDVPLVLNRSLTYGSLWLLIALLYAVVVGGVGALVRDEGATWLPWVAAGVVAVSFAPLRDALQRAANRVTYGQWASPDDVRARTSERLADAADLGVVLAELVEDLAVGLGLGYVEITDRTGARLTSSGTPTERCDDLPLTAYGETVGRLRWAARPLRDVDRALLVDLAERLGGLVQASGLVASVRQAQERLVLAREEERRRL